MLAAYGSRGDVQPVLALALKLREAGHEVLMCAPPEQVSWVEGFGCPCQASGSNLHGLFDNFPAPYTLKAIHAFLRFMKQETRVQFHQLPEIFMGADLILGASLVFGAPSVAEALGIPYRFIAFCPQLLSSSQHPSWALRNHNLPPWVNRLSWWALNHIDNYNFRAIINKERHRIGQQPINDVWDYLLGDHVLVASDPVLARVPGDVEKPYTQLGYFHLPQPAQPHDSLEAFLESGSPPVFVGFGSMPDTDPDATTSMLVAAARAAGQRVIISSGWAKLGRVEFDEDCHVVVDVPHLLLFPRVSVVVHHGGAGTTAAAARAGVPQIIIPHVLDQYYWAKQIHRAGLGPKPIWRSRLTTDGLAEAIHDCVSNHVMRQRAHEVSGVLQMQDSLSEAIKLIESAFPEESKVDLLP
jgi:UDP:flavonoid glycosyltransferase YjiC (YdhE family)